MSTIDLLDAAGAKGGTVELPGELFDVTTNIPLIHQVVNAQLAAARQGTHATKTRGLVRGGGVKPWRQKGTGRARQGSRRAPQWVGGGTVHGPQPRSYAQKTPKRMIQAALLGVLSDRARESRIVIIEAVATGQIPSTKQASAALAPVAQYRNILLVLDRDDYIGWLSVRNLPEVHAIAADQLNAYDVVVSDVVVFTRTAIETFVATRGASVTVQSGQTAAADAKAAETVADDAPETVDETVDAAEKAVDEATATADVATAEPDAKPAKAKKAADGAKKAADEAEAGAKAVKSKTAAAESKTKVAKAAAEATTEAAKKTAVKAAPKAKAAAKAASEEETK